MHDFKKKYSFEQRRDEALRIKKKYPDRIPIIIEKAMNSDIANIDKNKFLVPDDLTMGQFIYVIRKRIHLTSEKAIFIFINNRLVPTSSLMSQIYQEHADNDNFLYCHYCSESTFG